MGCDGSTRLRREHVVSRDVLDRDALERLERIGGVKLLAGMLDAFLANGAERLAAATSSAAALDGVGVSDAAHALKSSAGNIGARRLQETADRIEHTAEGAGADLRALTEELETAWIEAETAARALRRTLQ